MVSHHLDPAVLSGCRTERDLVIADPLAENHGPLIELSAFCWRWYTFRMV